MTTSPNEFLRKETGSAEETLRLIAGLPAPEGLVDRVQTRLRTAPRSGRILDWPRAAVSGDWRYSSAMRGAAAAAIVCVVVGGGWRIFSRVQPGPSARVVVMPGPAGPSRGFSIGGSMHTPDPRLGSVLPKRQNAEASRTETIDPVVVQPKHGPKAGNLDKGSKRVDIQPVPSRK